MVILHALHFLIQPVASNKFFFAGHLLEVAGLCDPLRHINTKSIQFQTPLSYQLLHALLDTVLQKTAESVHLPDICICLVHNTLQCNTDDSCKAF